MFQPVIFREYDIRGVYNGQFDDNFAYLLGRAYVVYMKQNKGLTNPTVALGCDARESSPAIIKNLAKGMMDSGAKVIHLGLVTTPVCYFSTFELKGVDGAIQVTGSHNPPEYNGFKISVGKGTIFGAEIQKLREIIQKGEYIDGKGSEEHFDIKPMYYERYKKRIRHNQRHKSRS
ncbi:hypothetical protein [Bdellovibrio bacteriovorus]|uniref:hypothetical protein n=1 Tax=Bdellovibrio bacteriovorus TaxID=959 RepID=UPI0035A66B98